MKRDLLKWKGNKRGAEAKRSKKPGANYRKLAPGQCLVGAFVQVGIESRRVGSHDEEKAKKERFDDLHFSPSPFSFGVYYLRFL